VLAGTELGHKRGVYQWCSQAAVGRSEQPHDARLVSLRAIHKQNPVQHFLAV
jgi:hypothetical protein